VYESKERLLSEALEHLLPPAGIPDPLKRFVGYREPLGHYENRTRDVGFGYEPFPAEGVYEQAIRRHGRGVLEYLIYTVNGGRAIHFNLFFVRRRQKMASPEIPFGRSSSSQT